MKQSILFMVVAGLVLVSSQAGAQGYGGFTFEQPTHRLEIIPMYGYTWTLSRSAYYNGFNGDLDFASSGSWGVAIDVNTKPGAQLRLLYRRQDTDLTWKTFADKRTLGDVAVEYYHIGGVVGVARDNIKPFSSLTLGGTRYVAGSQDSWKFSIILSVGAKIFINERIGLMVAGQMPLTFTDAFVGVGTGGVSFGGTGIAQFDVVGGLIIAL
jgi:hypothetical protein